MNLVRNRIKLNEQHTGFIIRSNYAEALGWAIEQHLDALPPKLKPTFWKSLDDTKTRKERFRKIVNQVLKLLLRTNNPPKKPESLVCLNAGNTTCRKPAQGEGSDGQHIGTNSWPSLPSTKL